MAIGRVRTATFSASCQKSVRVIVRCEAKEMRQMRGRRLKKNRRRIRWNTLKIFRAEDEADTSRSFAAVDWYDSDRLLGRCFIPGRFCPLSITPFFAHYLSPYFMHDPLLEAKPCRLIAQLFEVFDVGIRQGFWAWFGHEHFADRITFSYRRSYD